MPSVAAVSVTRPVLLELVLPESVLPESVLPEFGLPEFGPRRSAAAAGEASAPFPVSRRGFTAGHVWVAATRAA
jgi:hypothetical protein